MHKIVRQIIFGFRNYRLRVILGLFEVNQPSMNDKIKKLPFSSSKTMTPYYLGIH
jgi:hypothetical protein